MNSEIYNAAIRGDEKAFEYIYNATKDKAYSIALSVVKDEYEAEDVVIDSYISFQQNLSSVNEPEKLENWMYRIVKNKALDYVKKTKAISFSEFDSADDCEFSFEDTIENHYSDFSPEESIDYTETRRIVQEMINSLPEKQKTCITLRYAEGKKISEIAESTALSESTVKSCLKYGKEKILADVETLEKKGTKLYGISALAFVPFIMWVFNSQSNFAILQTNVAASQAGLEMNCQVGGIINDVAVNSASSQMAASTQALNGASVATKVGVAGAKAIVSTLPFKACAISVAVVAVVTGTVVPIVMHDKKKNEAQVETDSTTVLETIVEKDISDYVYSMRSNEYNAGGDVYKYDIPQITIDSDDAERVNSEIVDRYESLADEIEKVIADPDYLTGFFYYSVYYDAWIIDDLLVVVIYAENGFPHILTDYYTFDLNNGKLFSEDDILNYYGISYDEYYVALKSAIVSDYIEERKTYPDIYTEEGCDNTILDGNLKDRKMCVDKNGLFTVSYNSCVDAGAGSESEECVFPIPNAE